MDKGYRVQHKSEDGRWFDLNRNPVGWQVAEIMRLMAEKQGVPCRLVDASTGAPV